MCQIQMIHKFDKKELNNFDITQFERLMYFGNERNNDAWGIALINGELKALEKEGESFTDKSFRKAIKGHSGCTLIGHNRMKTKGDAKNKNNNHPFETEHFVVVHNGVLSNDDDLKKEYGLKYKVETDSYIIPALMEKLYNGMNELEAVKKTAGLIYGSYSVMTYCKDSGNIYYFKNSSTKFTFGLVDIGGEQILIGSTDDTNLKSIYGENVRGVFYKVREDMLEYEPDAEYIYLINEDGINPIDVFDEAKYVSHYKEETPAKTYGKWYGNEYKVNDEKSDISFSADDMEYAEKKLTSAIETTCGLKLLSTSFDAKKGIVKAVIGGSVSPVMLESIDDEMCVFGMIKSKARKSGSVEVTLSMYPVFAEDEAVSYVHGDRNMLFGM